MTTEQAFDELKEAFVMVADAIVQSFEEVISVISKFLEFIYVYQPLPERMPSAPWPAPPKREIDQVRRVNCESCGNAHLVDLFDGGCPSCGAPRETDQWE